MKLVYITSKKYPSRKADPFYVESMAKAFAKTLGKDFVFLVRGEVPSELAAIGSLSIKAPRRLRGAFYFLVLPIFLWRKGWHQGDTFFLSYDPNLLSILIFWRRVLGFRYKVASDWHQMFDDWRDAYVASGSDFLFTTSKRLKGQLVSRLQIPEEKIAVVYGGVDPAPFRERAHLAKEELRRTLSLPVDSYLVSYVGGFTSIGRPKGLATMLEAIPKLPREVVMVFVGGSDRERAEYISLSESSGVSGQCLFIRKQPFQKVVEYEMAMDLLVIPYPDEPHFRDYGFPMKVWEYMAAGRPILYSKLEIMEEVLSGRGGSFRPGDATDLARAVNLAYSKKVEVEEVASRNPLLLQKYTWDARARTIVERLRSLEV